VALPGAVLAVVVVHLLGRPAGTHSVVPLILAGAVVSAVLYAYIQAMILTRPEVFDSYRHWAVGSLAGASYGTLAAVAPALVLGVVLAAVAAPGLNTLALGDDVATSLGTPVALLRATSLLAATLLAAAATAAVGPIAFVGLAVPHLVRALVGGDHRWQLPVSLVLGAALLLGSDVLARVIARPQELMVGVVTAFIGAPFLLWAVRRGRVTT
jgi:iron complex transport system permease protein